MSRSAGRSTGPSFESVVERSDLRVTEQPGDLLERNAMVFEITNSETVPQRIRDFRKGGAFLGEVPCE
jgi:hypothetical protein